jgi:hypothetical protein
MRRSFKLCLSVLVTFSLSGLIEPTLAATAGEKNKITICVYDHSRLKSGTLVQAEKEADRIFRQAGVETEWQDLPTSEAEAGGKTNLLEQLGPTGFVLKILPKSMTEQLQIRDAALGYSIPCPEDGSACIANILYHRVQDLAQSENVSVAQTLGLAMAHEIGHLLLRSHAHSNAGVMQPRWRAKDLQQAGKGLLPFTPEQAEFIRADVLKRMARQELVRVANPIPCLPSRLPALATSKSLDTTDRSLVVHVLVDDYAEVSAEALAKAEDRAGTIFRQAGVKLAWVNRSREMREPKNKPLSQDTLNQIHYVLRILPHSRAKLKDSALGEALTCAPGEAACFANLFYNRVQQRTDIERISLAQVLGHAMAHELGHVLLGSNSHSSRGIMRGSWSAADIELMTKGDLLFTPDEVGVIRSNAFIQLAQSPPRASDPSSQ